MKIVDEKGKLFGLVNLVDLLVILLIVAVVAVVGIKLFGSKATDLVAEKTDVYVEVEISPSLPRLYTEVYRQLDTLIGASMVTGNEYLDAKIQDIWFEDYIALNVNDEGKLVTENDPVRKGIVFLLKGSAAPDSPTLKIGAQELRAGKSYIIKTQTFECTGSIRYVNVGEYSGVGPNGENVCDMGAFLAGEE